MELAEHNSREALYRYPQGAMEAGQRVRLGIRLSPELKLKDGESVQLRLWQEGYGELLVPLAPCEADVRARERGAALLREAEAMAAQAEAEQEQAEMAALLTEAEAKSAKAEALLNTPYLWQTEMKLPQEGGLLWYYFVIPGAEKNLYYCNAEDELGGRGTLREEPLASFQLTVYEKGAATPSWLRKAVMYQIFPDRFHRAGDKIVPKRGALLHTDWNDTPHYFKDEKGDVIAYDFFGGNLQGIRAKLPYLQELGISLIYLNPIFASVSNHRYDTGDYKEVDPLLGSEADLKELLADAGQRGIRIILDGVFSHTGADSRYFNRFGNYDAVGACQSQDSPYYKWYEFEEYPDKYKAWWGFTNLPNVNETEPAYLDYIIRDRDSVLHHWADAGIAGWRLDVLDELPPEFSCAFYKELKKTNPEAVVIGEVWEDASHKISYGKQREYFCHGEADGVMNYPFRRAVLDFLLGRADGGLTLRRLASLQENYPQHNFYAVMNLLGSHDVERLLTLLGEAPSAEGQKDSWQAAYRLSEEQLSLGRRRVRLGMLWQFTFPGVPSIYYGDEAGMQGYADPYNRGTYPWQNEDREQLAWTCKAVALRNKNAALSTGELIPLKGEGDIYAFARRITGGKDSFGEPAADGLFITALNRSTTGAREVGLNLRNLASGSWRLVFSTETEEQALPELLSSAELAALSLPPLTGAVYQLLPQSLHYRREAGVLLHPTSLPSRYGCGDLGAVAKDFVDFLATAGQRVWQILPLNPVGLGASPYQSPSAFAGNPLLIAPMPLVKSGWLLEQEADEAELPQSGRIDFEAVRANKEKMLRRAYARFSRRQPTQSFLYFCQHEKYWLDDYALFCALKKETDDAHWTEWPQPLRDREPAALAEAMARLESEVQYVRFVQYNFFRQWQELHQEANRHGIALLGDMPIFVAHDSADVWAHRGLFLLEEDGSPSVVAGVPPDYFSATGQLWGNPLYDWVAMERDGYAWWEARLRHLLKMVDRVRIDHFRGFEAYWEIPAEAKTAMEGKWVKGPGEKLFRALEKKMGRLNIIAEDLGVITPEVEALRDKLGYPGMKVLHFALEPDADGRLAFLPPENSVAYTGTHDNNTTCGWYREETDALLRAALLEACELRREDEAAGRLIELAYRSAARLVIVPVQDLLALGSEARMNLPGTVGGNWSWRLGRKDLSPQLAQQLKELVHETGRLN